MNKSKGLRAIFLASNLIAVPIHAQIANAPSPAPAITYLQTTRIVGMKVKDSNGETVGTIKDVVLDRDNGCIAYTVLSTGDKSMRLTGTAKTVAVPWAVYNLNADPSAMILKVDRERVYGAPSFEYSRMNEYSTGTYINEVSSYYGVHPSMATSAESTAPSSVQSPTPAQTESETAASPVATATASPSPSMTPTATPTPSQTATTTPGQTPTAANSPSATVKPHPSRAAAAIRASTTPPATAKQRKTSAEPPGEGPGSPAKKIRRYRPTPTPSPTPKKTTW